MANSIDPSKRVIYAQEAYNELEKALGLVNSVYSDFDNEVQEKGDAITIDVPSQFVAGDVATQSDGNDLSTSKLTVNLSEWKGVKFQVNDKEIAEVREGFIQNHLRPAAHAVVQAVEEDLMSLYKYVPWYRKTQGTDAPVKDITALRKLLKDQKVPTDGSSFLAMDTERYMEMLNQNLVIAANQASDGGQAQVTGVRNQPIAGFNPWESLMIPTHSAGSVSSSAPKVKGATSKDATTVVVDDTSLTGDVNVGDIVSFAGHTQQYTITADASASGNEISLSIYPALQADVDNDAAVTFEQETSKDTVNLAYHRTFAALAIRPLAENERSTVITDPNTGLSLRLEMWRDSDNSKNWARIDALWGFAILDGNRAARYLS